MKTVWRSPAVGVWYQDSKMALEYDLEHLKQEITVVRRKKICAAVVPHAAFRFSGKTLAGVFLRIDPRAYSRIVIIAPSHYEELRNTISTPHADEILTPLGPVSVDRDWQQRFLRLPFAIQSKTAHAREHSDQIHLPFIQYYFSLKLPVVTLICGEFDAERLLEMADRFHPLLDDHTLLVVSSDFTHFGSNFGDLPSFASDEKRRESDAMNLFEIFASGDLRAFLRQLRSLGHHICLHDPLPLLMAMMPDQFKVIRTTGTAREGATYAGALVEGAWSSCVNPLRDTAGAHQPLIEEEGKKLLALAASSLRGAFRTGVHHPIWTIQPAGLTPRLRSTRGGYVTLSLDGRRLGCMGEIIPRRAIWQVVQEQTLNAAFHDSRVAPLAADQWARCGIEIEVVTEPRVILDLKKIVLGRHGIILRMGANSAIFRPRQPMAAGWDLEETLEQLAAKAGVAGEEWREKASFLVFESQIFHGKVEDMLRREPWHKRD